MKESIEQSKPEAIIYDFNLLVYIDDMAVKNVSEVEMGCYFNQVEFTDDYLINN